MLVKIDEAEDGRWSMSFDQDDFRPRKPSNWSYCKETSSPGASKSNEIALRGGNCMLHSQHFARLVLPEWHQQPHPFHGTKCFVFLSRSIGPKKK